MNKGDGVDGAVELSSRFRMRRRLGVGGMGAVYEAFDERRDHAVALKVMVNVEPLALQRFKNEFRALADLRHRNLVQLYELISEDDQWLLSMEYVDGVDFLTHVRPRPCPVGADAPESPPATVTLDTVDLPAAYHPSLYSRLEAVVGKLDEPRLRRALRQLAEGLHALHRARRLHLDLKSSNILVDRAGRVVICDFGMTRRLEPGAQTAPAEEGVAGTVSHMAPEQAARQPLSPASDWYAVGVILYQALSGRLPFEGSSGDILVRKQSVTPPALAGLDPAAPADLSALCHRLLSIRPADRPGGEEVLRLLGREGPIDAGEVTRDTSVFLGRGVELAGLRAAFEEAAAGPAVLALIRGASGVGKSALVQQFLRELRDSGSALVLAGRCYQYELVPHKALDEAIDELARVLADLPRSLVEPLVPVDVGALSRLFPVLRRVRGIAVPPMPTLPIRDGRELRRRAVTALRELLASLASERPIVIAIDDLQWGDAGSGTLLRELLHSNDSRRLLVVGTVRADEAADSPTLQALASSGDAALAPRAHIIELDELPRDRAQELARRLLGARAGDDQVRAIAREARGNPLFVAELSRYVRGGARLSDESSDGELRLDDVIAARIEGLAPAARALLDVVCAAGRPVDVEVARLATEVGPDFSHAVAVLGVESLVRCIVVRQRESLVPYHARIRDAVLPGIAPSRVRWWHRLLAEAHERADLDDPEVLLSHWLAAGETGRAAELAVRAGEQAARNLAFDVAAGHYELALRLGDHDAERERALRVALADALANAGRGAEAAERYVEAAEAAPAADTLELRRRAAEQWLYTGHLERGRQAIQDVLGDVGVSMAPTPRRALVSFAAGRALARLRGMRYRARDPSQIAAEQLRRVDVLWSASTGLSMIETIHGADFQTRHLRLALATGEPHRVARALAMESAYVATRGARSRSRAERLVARSRALADELDDPYTIAFCHLTEGVGAYLRGEWRRAWDATRRAEQILREQCVGAAWELTNATVYALSSLAYLGDMQMMGRLISDRLRDAEEHGNLYMVNFLRAGAANVMWLAQNRDAEAERQVAEAERQWAYPGFHVQHYFMLWARVQVALYRGDPAMAWRLVSERWPQLERSLLLRVRYVELQALHLRARAALAHAGAEPSLLRRALRDARRIEGEGADWTRATAASIRAGIDAREGRAPQAAARYAEAAAGFERSEMKLFAGACRVQQARCEGDAESIAAAERACRDAGVVRPVRFADTLAPGVPPAS